MILIGGRGFFVGRTSDFIALFSYPLKRLEERLDVGRYLRYQRQVARVGQSQNTGHRNIS